MLDDFDFLDDDSLTDEEIVALVESEGLEPLIDESLFDDDFDDVEEDSDWAE
jgi:hypothetical protein